MHKFFRILETIWLITALACAGIAVYFLITKDNDSALYFTRRELELVSRLKDTAAMVVCLSNMGLIFKKSGDLQQAESRIRQALTIVEQGSRDEYSLSGLYNNLGSILMAKKDFKQAEINFLKSLDYANQGELRQIVLENFAKI